MAADESRDHRPLQLLFRFHSGKILMAQEPKVLGRFSLASEGISYHRSSIQFVSIRNFVVVKITLGNNRAAALLITIGILAVLSVMAFTFATSTRIELDAARSYNNGVIAELAARGALEMVMAALSQDDDRADSFVAKPSGVVDCQTSTYAGIPIVAVRDGLLPSNVLPSEVEEELRIPKRFLGYKQERWFGISYRESMFEGNGMKAVGWVQWHINEDPPGDANHDGAPGIRGWDDDGDGRVDEDYYGRLPGLVDRDPDSVDVGIYNPSMNYDDDEDNDYPVTTHYPKANDDFLIPEMEEQPYGSNSGWKDQTKDVYKYSTFVGGPNMKWLTNGPRVDEDSTGEWKEYLDSYNQDAKDVIPIISHIDQNWTTEAADRAEYKTDDDVAELRSLKTPGWGRDIDDQDEPRHLFRSGFPALTLSEWQAFDDDFDGIVDEAPPLYFDEDGDGLVNEDPPGDANFDGYPGIRGVDDDGDGLVDEDLNGKEPDDPDYSGNTPPHNEDDDEDGLVDEDINKAWRLDDDLDGIYDDDPPGDTDYEWIRLHVDDSDHGDNAYKGAFANYNYFKATGAKSIADKRTGMGSYAVPEFGKLSPLGNEEAIIYFNDNTVVDAVKYLTDTDSVKWFSPVESEMTGKIYDDKQVEDDAKQDMVPYSDFGCDDDEDTRLDEDPPSAFWLTSKTDFQPTISQLRNIGTNINSRRMSNQSDTITDEDYNEKLDATRLLPELLQGFARNPYYYRGESEARYNASVLSEAVLVAGARVGANAEDDDEDLDNYPDEGMLIDEGGKLNINLHGNYPIIEPQGVSKVHRHNALITTFEVNMEEFFRAYGYRDTDARDISRAIVLYRYGNDGLPGIKGTDDDGDSCAKGSPSADRDNDGHTKSSESAICRDIDNEDLDDNPYTGIDLTPDCDCDGAADRNHMDDDGDGLIDEDENGNQPGRAGYQSPVTGGEAVDEADEFDPLHPKGDDRPYRNIDEIKIALVQSGDFNAEEAEEIFQRVKNDITAHVSEYGRDRVSVNDWRWDNIDNDHDGEVDEHGEGSKYFEGLNPQSTNPRMKKQRLDLAKMLVDRLELQWAQGSLMEVNQSLGTPRRPRIKGVNFVPPPLDCDNGWGTSSSDEDPYNLGYGISPIQVAANLIDYRDADDIPTKIVWRSDNVPNKLIDVHTGKCINESEEEDATVYGTEGLHITSYGALIASTLVDQGKSDTEKGQGGIERDKGNYSLRNFREITENGYVPSLRIIGFDKRKNARPFGFIPSYGNITCGGVVAVEDNGVTDPNDDGFVSLEWNDPRSYPVSSPWIWKEFIRDDHNSKHSPTLKYGWQIRPKDENLGITDEDAQSYYPGEENGPDSYMVYGAWRWTTGMGPGKYLYEIIDADPGKYYDPPNKQDEQPKPGKLEFKVYVTSNNNTLQLNRLDKIWRHRNAKKLEYTTGPRVLAAESPTHYWKLANGTRRLLDFSVKPTFPKPSPRLAPVSAGYWGPKNPRSIWIIARGTPGASFKGIRIWMPYVEITNISPRPVRLDGFGLRIDNKTYTFGNKSDIKLMNMIWEGTQTSTWSDNVLPVPDTNPAHFLAVPGYTFPRLLGDYSGIEWYNNRTRVWTDLARFQRTDTEGIQPTGCNTAVIEAKYPTRYGTLVVTFDAQAYRSLFAHSYSAVANGVNEEHEVRLQSPKRFKKTGGKVDEGYPICELATDTETPFANMSGTSNIALLNSKGAIMAGGKVDGFRLSRVAVEDQMQEATRRPPGGKMNSANGWKFDAFYSPSKTENDLLVTAFYPHSKNCVLGECIGVAQPGLGASFHTTWTSRPSGPNIAPYGGNPGCAKSIATWIQTKREYTHSWRCSPTGPGQDYDRPGLVLNDSRIHRFADLYYLTQNKSERDGALSKTESRWYSAIKDDHTDTHQWWYFVDPGSKQNGEDMRDNVGLVNTVTSLISRIALPGTYGRVNVNTASHPVLMAATQGNSVLTAHLVKRRPYIFNPDNGQLGDEILADDLFGGIYGNGAWRWSSRYLNILGVRSTAFTVVARGKVATLDGNPLANRTLRAIIDRSEDTNLDGAPDITLKYFSYDQPMMRVR